MIASTFLVLAALLLGSAAHLMGEKAGGMQGPTSRAEDFLYLPEGKILRVLSLGHRSFVADIVWLYAIQYYGEQKLTGQHFDQTERLFTAIYDLDSSFKGATRFGALVLAQDAGAPQAALALLERASRDHPRDWEYPFDQAFIHHTVLRNFGAAGEAYRRAAELPGAPDVALRLAGISFARLGDRESSREIWRAIREETGNGIMRSLAERNLKNLDMDEHQELLAGGARRFREKRGAYPRDWEELVRAGFLAGVPEEPFGGAYFLDPRTGDVWATTHVDRRMAQERDIFAGLVAEYHARSGAYPDSLEQLVAAGLVKSVPWEPFGLRLDYDPGTGAISWNPPWPATEPGKHGEG